MLDISIAPGNFITDFTPMPCLNPSLQPFGVSAGELQQHHNLLQPQRLLVPLRGLTMGSMPHVNDLRECAWQGTSASLDMLQCR